MSADTEPLDAATLRKKAIQLRHFIDQGEFVPGEDDDDQLLRQVFTEDELDSIEEHNEQLYLALTQVQIAYDKATDIGAQLEACQNAIDSHVIVLSVEQDEEEAAAEEEPADDEPYEGDGDDHISQGDDDEEHDPEDPDADLEED